MISLRLSYYDYGYCVMYSTEYGIRIMVLVYVYRVIIEGHLDCQVLRHHNILIRPCRYSIYLPRRNGRLSLPIILRSQRYCQLAESKRYEVSLAPRPVADIIQRREKENDGNSHGRNGNSFLVAN